MHTHEERLQFRNAGGRRGRNPDVHVLEYLAIHYSSGRIVVRANWGFLLFRLVSNCSAGDFLSADVALRVFNLGPHRGLCRSGFLFLRVAWRETGGVLFRSPEQRAMRSREPHVQKWKKKAEVGKRKGKIVSWNGVSPVKIYRKPQGLRVLVSRSGEIRRFVNVFDAEHFSSVTRGIMCKKETLFYCYDVKK